MLNDPPKPTARRFASRSDVTAAGAPVTKKTRTPRRWARRTKARAPGIAVERLWTTHVTRPVRAKSTSFRQP